MHRCTLLALAILLAFVQPSAAQKAPRAAPVTIYVGPLVRDGVVETDGGIDDSIKDLKHDIGTHKAELRLVDTPGEAALVVIVLARYTGGEQGVVATRTGALTIAAQIKGKVVEALLRVGAYEKPLVREDEAWSECADAIVKDIRVWLKANRAMVKDL